MLYLIFLYLPPIQGKHLLPGKFPKNQHTYWPYSKKSLGNSKKSTEQLHFWKRPQNHWAILKGHKRQKNIEKIIYQ